MTIAFFNFWSLNGTQVQMNLTGFLIHVGKYVPLYYIEFTAAMLEKIQTLYILEE